MNGAAPISDDKRRFETADGTQHVDGATGTISDSANLQVELDPVGAKSGGGNAFDAVGSYTGLVKLTFSDGDITRHPGDGDLQVFARDKRGS